MSSFKSALVLMVSVTALTACSDDPVGVNSGDPMTEEEIQAVFFAIADAFETVSTGPAASGPARATQSYSGTFSETAPCAPGGTIGVSGQASGTFDDEANELDATFRLRLTPSGCVVETETNVITLEAAPYIQLDMDFFLSEATGQLAISGSQTGGIAYTSSDGRSGSCRFEVQFSGSADLDAGTGNSQVSGTVCGVSASNLSVFELGA